MQKYSLWLVALMFIAGWAVAGDITLVNNQRGGVELLWTLESYQVQEVGDYTIVTFPGGSGIFSVGKPNLPSQQTFVEIPMDSTARIIVEPLKVEKILVKKPVAPAQEPFVDAVGAEKVLPRAVAFDQAFYQTNAVFPGQVAEVAYQGILRGRNLALLRISPIQYNPKTGEVIVYRQCKINVEYVGGARSIAETDDAMDMIAQAMVINYQPGQQRKVRGVDYLIITVPDLETSARNYAAWKIKKGLNVQVEVLSIKPTVATVKETIMKYYPGLKYVLILADHPLIALPTSSTVRHPLGDANCKLLGQEDATVPSDLHYACLEGADYYPDIYVGRVPANNVQEAELLLGKLIKYQFSPPQDDCFSRFLLCGEFQYQYSKTNMAERLFCETAFVIHNSLKDKYTFPTKTIGTGSSGLGHPEYYFRRAADVNDPLKPGTYRSKMRDNEEPVVDCKMPAEWATNIVSDTEAKANTIAFWNQGCGIVQHRDHGGETLWGKPSLTAADVGKLTNGDRAPILFSINCLTGAMDYSSDCFVETVLKNPNGGATAALGASRVSYSWWNDRLCDGFYTCMYGTDVYDCFDVGVKLPTEHPFSKKLGVVLNFGKMYLAKNYPANPWGTSSDYTEIEFYLFHCIGDPEMDIWTAPLLKPHVMIDNRLISVANIGNFCPVVGAQVCLLGEDGTQIVMTTNQAGDCTIPAEVRGNFTLTITGENLYTYQETLKLE